MNTNFCAPNCGVDASAAALGRRRMSSPDNCYGSCLTRYSVAMDYGRGAGVGRGRGVGLIRPVCGFTTTQAENSDVLPLGSVAVAVIT